MSPSRIAVLLCSNEARPEKRPSLERLAAFAATLDDVVFVELFQGDLTPSDRARVAKKLVQHRPDRAVLVGTSFRGIEPQYRELVVASGIGSGMVEVVNLGWPSNSNAVAPPSDANARTLLRMAIAKCRLLSPSILVRTDILRRAVVLGNGLCATVVSLELVTQGFDVDMLLIGNELISLDGYAFPDDSSRSDAATKMASMHPSSRIRLHHISEVSSIKGFAGDFEITFKGIDGNESVKGGAIVLAQEPELVGTERENSSVMTNSSFRSMIDADAAVPKVVVFVEGSPGKGSCPAQGTTAAIENALAIKKRRPEMQVYVLAKDIDAPGAFERTYHRAQGSGIVFVRGDFSYRNLEEDPGSLIINDPVAGEVRIRPSLIVRDATFDIRANSDFAKKLGLRSSGDGMAQRFSTRLHAGETAREGVYVCHGLGASILASDNISEASAVASSVSELLSKSFLEHGAETAFVDEEKCSACLACVRICPYDAPLIGEKGKAEIQIARCQGCGMCVSLCPSKAIDQRGWTDAQLSVEIMIASKGERE